MSDQCIGLVPDMCAADDYDNEDDDDDYSGFERDMCAAPLPATVQLFKKRTKIFWQKHHRLLSYCWVIKLYLNSASFHLKHPEKM